MDIIRIAYPYFAPNRRYMPNKRYLSLKARIRKLWKRKHRRKTTKRFGTDLSQVRGGGDMEFIHP